jgi:hypothetical protein
MQVGFTSNAMLLFRLLAGEEGADQDPKQPGGGDHRLECAQVNAFLGISATAAQGRRLAGL